MKQQYGGKLNNYLIQCRAAELFAGDSLPKIVQEFFPGAEITQIDDEVIIVPRPPKMTKAEKLETFDYYQFATTCVCGQPKETNHWCCESCKNAYWLRPEALDLATACANHVVQAKRFLALCKSRPAPVAAPERTAHASSV